MWLIWRVKIIFLCSCLCLADEIKLAEYTCQFELDNSSFAECYTNHTTVAITIELINYEHLPNLTFNSDLHFVKKLAFANLITFENDLVKNFVYLEKLDIIGDPIYNNNINNLPDLQSLQQLNELNVYNNNLGHTWNRSLSHLAEHRLLPISITDLHLVANKITYLPLWIGELDNLKFIDLNYNELEYIPAVLKSLKHLKYLHLNLNYIISLNTFNSMPSLVYLDAKLQNSQRMIVENYAFDKRNSEEVNEEYLIDLIARYPDQLEFENLALCSTFETKNTSRRLLLSNNSLNNCILKQFQGLIDIYYFDSGNYDTKMLIKSLDFRECQHKNASHEEHCISIKNCTHIYECQASSFTLSTKKQNLSTTMSSYMTSKIYKVVVTNSTLLKNNFNIKQSQLGHVFIAFTFIRLFVKYF